MPLISFEDAFKGQTAAKAPTVIPFEKIQPEISQAALDADQLKRARDAAARVESIDLVQRSLANTPFADIEVTGAKADEIPESEIPSILAEAESSDEFQAATQALSRTRELKASMDRIQSARSLGDIQQDAIKNVPRPLRPFATGFAQAGLRSASALARAVQFVGVDIDVADALSREAGAVSRARQALGSSQIENAVESAVISLTDVFTTAGFGLGAKGIAVAAGIRASNDAVTEGRDAGLEGLQLANFAAGQGAIETGLTLAFGKVLGAGLEGAATAPLKTGAKRGIVEGLKKFGLTSLAELPEEITIEIFSAAQRQFADVDPNAIDAALSQESMTQIVLATLMTAGAAEGIRAGEARLSRDPSKKASPIVGDTAVAPGDPTPEAVEASNQLIESQLPLADALDSGDEAQIRAATEQFVIEAAVLLDDPTNLTAEVKEGLSETRQAVEEALGTAAASDLPSDTELGINEPAGAALPASETTTDPAVPGNIEAVTSDPKATVEQAAQEAAIQAQKITEATKQPSTRTPARDPAVIAAEKAERAARPAKVKKRKAVVRKVKVKKVTEAKAFADLKAKVDADPDAVSQTPRRFFGAGFRRAASQGRAELSALKTNLQGEATLQDASRKKLISLAQQFLPLAERGKLITTINNAKTPRQAQAVRGRILSRLEEVAKRDASNRFLRTRKKIKFRKLEQPIREAFGKDLVTFEKAKLDLNALTAEEINEFADTLDSIIAFQKNLKDLRLGTAAKSLDDLSKAIKERVETTGTLDSDDTVAVGQVKEFFNEQNLKPEELMIQLDGDEKGPARQALYQAPKDGMTKVFSVRRISKDFFEKHLNLDKFRKWSHQEAGKKVVTETIKLESGKKLTLTRNELIYLIASGRTQANREAILKAGITLRRQRNKKKLAITEQDFELFEGAAAGADSDIGKAADTIKDYLNRVLKPEYDKAHIDLNGFSNVVEDYLPIRRNSNEKLPTTFDITTYNQMALNEISESKERTGGTTSVMIDDAFTVVDNHVRRVSGFIGMAKVLRNASMVLNHPRVANAMDSKFGVQRRAAISRLYDAVVQDIVGYRASSPTFFGRLFSKLIDNATKGVLSANPAVILKQPVSVLVASTEIEKSFLARAAGAGAKMGSIGSKLAKDVEQRMMDNNPDIWARYQAPRLRLVGQFVNEADANIIDRAKGLGDKMMGGISAFDKAAIRVIYRASEIKVTETTNLKFGTPEYIAAVNKIANSVIDRTQPAFNVLDQAGIALEGRTSALTKLSTAMFMSQRNQNFNIIRRAIRRGGRKGLRDLTTVMVLSPLFIMAIDELRRWAYGYDDDRTATERTTASMVSLIEQNLSTVYGAQIAVDMLQPVKKLLLGEKAGRFRQSENVLEGVYRQAGQGFNDIFDAVAAGSDTFKAGDKRGQSIATDKILSGITNLTFAAGSTFGLPISSPLRLTIGLGERLVTDTDYKVMLRERSRLRKIQRREKETGTRLLSDFQREKLGVIEEAVMFANLAHRSVEKGSLNREEANQYINDRVSGAMRTIETLEDTVPAVTLSPIEKPKDDEVEARRFYSRHGELYFKFEAAKLAAARITRELKAVPKAQRRAFLKLNPEAREGLKADARLRQLSTSIAKLRKAIMNPSTTESRKAQFHERIAKLLRKAQDL